VEALSVRARAVARALLADGIAAPATGVAER